MARQFRCSLLATLIVGVCATPGFTADSTTRLFELEAGDLPAFRGAEAAWRVRADTGLLGSAPGRLTFETPDGLAFEARKIGFERRGPGSLTWRGRLTDSVESRAILSMEGGALSGWIHTPVGDYEIRPLVGGSSAVLRMANEPPGGCEARQAPVSDALPTAAALPRSGVPPVAADSPSSIDLLALYTPEARDAMGGVEQVKSRIRLMVDLTNEAFANSRMQARLKLAHIAISPVPERGSMRDNLDPLRESPEVRTLRDEHSADLVALVQSRDPDNCGIAYIMDEIGAGFSPYAYSITAYNCVSVMAHELGHNMGMEHDPANGGPADSALFPWAFGHFLSSRWRTVMAYPDPCGGCLGVPYYSNPDVDYEGQPTGIPEERDNARVGNQTAGAIANFRLSGVLLADDFESGAPAGWQKNRGAMGVAQPGLEGDYLLSIPLADLSNRRYLMHRIPGAGKRVDVEFLFNANAVELAGAEVDILVLFGKGKAHTKLVLEQDGEQHRVSLVSQGNDGQYVEIANVPVRATRTERLQIEWRAATGPEAADGFVRLLKNDRSRGALSDFANDRWVAKQVRLGLPSGDTGTSGSGGLFVDNYSATVPTDIP